MDLSLAPQILGYGIIAGAAGSLAAVWYLRRKGYWEARARRRHQESP
ncbi:MAG: hypothetical protein M3261_04475 [Thermoproteota archaeon]|nr:hypothetical protein [Thermoproteota archaeon]